MNDVSGAPMQPGSDGDRRVVTVMFADISGFTALADQRDAEVVLDVINECFALLVPIIEAHGGTVDKFIGDCVMALFGAPTASEDDAERALDAALAMMSAFQEFVRNADLPLDLHFGINTGAVISARIGYGAQRPFSVIGDAVNLAARLEDLSVPGEILVGPSTWRQTAARFEFEALGPTALKGKGGSVAVYRLLGRKARPAGARDGSAPFVGRATEMATLRHLLDEAKRGGGAAVEIVADAGVGKSRLIDEMRASAGGTRWLEVRASAQQRAAGFGLARQAIQVLAGAGPDTETEALGEAIRTALGADADEAEVAYLSTIAGLPTDPKHLTAFEDLSEKALEQRFSRAFRRLIVVQSALQPTVLVCEDLHWADRSSLRLLRGLVGDEPVPGLLAVFSRRPEPDEAGRLRLPGAVPMPLEALSEREAGELLALLLDGAGNEGLTRAIIDRAEGNPYFLEEIARALGEGAPRETVAAGAGGEVSAERSELPLTVQGVIMSRLDRLYPAGRQALQTASVIGRTFEVALLSRVADDKEPWRKRLRPILRDLHQRDFTRPNDERAASYRFKHGLAQEVAYESMLHARRRALHRSVAEVLAKRSGAANELAPTLAYHLERAGLRHQAAVQLLHAGAMARATHANAEAVDHFTRAADLLGSSANKPEDLDRLCDAHEGAGDVLLLTGRSLEALQRFEAALGIVEASAATRRGSLLRRCGQARMVARDAHGAREFYEQAIATLEASPDPDDAGWLSEWIRANLDVLWPLYWTNQPGRMQEIIDKVREPLKRHGTGKQALRLLDREVMLRLQIEGSAVSDTTVRLAREAAEAAERVGGISARTLARQTLGYCLWLNGRAAEAVGHHESALALARRSGNADQETLALSNLSIIQRVLQDPETCIERSTQMMDVARQSANWVQVGVGHANLAWAALRKGDAPRARAEVDKAFELWRDQTFRMQWLGWGPLLALAVDEGDWDRVRSVLDKLLDPEELQALDAVPARLAKLRDAVDDASPRRASLAKAAVKAGRAVGLT